MISYEYHTSREQWLAARKRGIGGSAAGTILGVSNYETPWQYWARAKGILPQKEETPEMRAGHLLEPVVVKLFAEETGSTEETGTAMDFTVQNSDYPGVVASPDRIMKTAGGRRLVLECKTTQRTISEETLPKSWYCQLQLYMTVCDIKQGAIAWLSRGVDFGWLPVQRNEEFVAYMMPRLAEFWRNYIDGEQTPPLESADAALAFPLSTERVVELSSEAYTAAERLQELRASRKALEEEESQLTDYIKGQMQDAGVATFQGETVATWKTSKPREAFDSKAFKAAYPDLYKAFVKEGKPTRPFLLK